MKIGPAIAAAAGRSAHAHLLTRAAWIAVLSLSVKVAAMGKDVFVARWFGAGAELDAFLVALAVPLFMWAVVAQTFSLTFMPVLVRVHQQQGPEAAHMLIRGMFGGAILTLAVLVVALSWSAHWFLPLIGSGFDARELALAERLFQILVWIVPLSGISTYWSGILNASEAFTAPALAPIVIPLSMLVAVRFLVPQLGIDALAWSMVAGYTIECLIVGGNMLRHRLPVLPSWRLHGQMGHITRQYCFLFTGALLMSSSTLIDQSMATWLGPGSVSVLSYGAKLTAVILGTLSVGLTTAVLPHFSKLVARGDRSEVTRTLAALVKAILLGTMPLTALLIALSGPIARLLYERGAMTANSTAQIAVVQACYLLQVPVYIVGVVGTRLLCALSGNLILLRTCVVGVTFNIVGNLVFLNLWGVAGIALSTSCMYVATTTMIYFGLRARLRQMMPAGEVDARLTLAA